MYEDLVVPEFIALSGAQRIQMDQQRIALGIAPVAADADVLRIDDDIPRLPLLRISWPCRQRLRMTFKNTCNVSTRRKSMLGSDCSMP